MDLRLLVTWANKYTGHLPSKLQLAEKYVILLCNTREICMIRKCCKSFGTPVGMFKFRDPSLTITVGHFEIKCLKLSVPTVFTALHGMPARTSYEKGVRLSVHH